MEPGKIRIDKYLWAVRVFKTRSIATEACGKEKVKIGGQLVKASRNVVPGDIVTVRFGPFERILKVIQTVHNRLPAKLVSEYYEDITPKEEIDRMKAHAAARGAWRSPGMGRPTKKERRDLDDFMDFEDW
jgi:ribosome-associated heat shock protein Hsp15